MPPGWLNETRLLREQFRSTRKRMHGHKQPKSRGVTACQYRQTCFDFPQRVAIDKVNLSFVSVAAVDTERDEAMRLKKSFPTMANTNYY
jgi:hypothetical protein